jgi:hypothetical protein
VAQIKALGIQPLLDDGRLVDLFPDWPDDRLTLYALYPSRHLSAAKVRAFIEFVMAAISPKAGRPRCSFRSDNPLISQGGRPVFGLMAAITKSMKARTFAAGK